MKLRFLLLALAGVGMLASCSKDAAEGSANAPDGSKSIVLKISAPQATRAITPDAPYVEDGTDITSIAVYFTNLNGTIKYAYLVTDANNNLTNIKDPNKGLRFVGLSDVSCVYCVANDVLSQEQLTATVETNIKTTFSKNLGDQQPAADQDETIFVGYADNIQPLKVDEDTNVPNYDPDSDAPVKGDHVYTANITIRPMISRIEWGKIEILGEGSKVFEQNGKKFLVKWAGWTPTLTGLFQSNVYLTSQIFAAQVSNFFETPASFSAVVNGAWEVPAELAEVWTNAVLSYSGYTDATPGQLLDLTTYNPTAGTAACIPFHFFVPFAASSASASNNDVNAADPFNGNVPHWHFQMQFADQDAYTYTVYNYNTNYGDDATKYTDADKADLTDDDALNVSVQFIYPTTGTDNLAYANVVNLFKKNTSTPIVYQPGKIYTADIQIAPFNLSPSFEDITQYNIIVKVNVADFEKEEVTPSFN